MPAASTGYEVVRQATVTHTGSQTINAPSGTFVVWAFSIWESTALGGFGDKIVHPDQAAEQKPVFDGSGNMTGVEFIGTHQDHEHVIVCVGA